MEEWRERETTLDRRSNYLIKINKVKYVAKQAMNCAWLEGIPYSTNREWV